MNLFAKKILGAAAIVQLTVLACSAQTAVNLGNLPLWFEANGGQADSTSSFIAHGRDSEIVISPSGAEIILRKADGKIATARMQFVGANPSAEISGGEEMSGKISYLIGNDATHWQSGVSTFGQVRVTKIYPGVGVVYYGNQQRLEYDFDLAPGVKPETIAIRFDGADKISVNPQGELVVGLAGREIIQHRPIAYQISGSARYEIKAGYKILDSHTVAFTIDKYDSSLPLVIDPVLSYSTFFGGNNTDLALAVALDNETNIYLAGQTFSTDVSNNIPFATPNAFQTNNQSKISSGNAFVAKFDNTGSNLIYCTYLGGRSDAIAYALAVDKTSGNAFVAGETDSTNFPTLNAIAGIFNGAIFPGKFDPNLNQYPFSAFVTELSADGSHLVYSTFLGGKNTDGAFGITLDEDDNAFVTGYTFSTNFPVTANAFQTNFAFRIGLNSIYLNANAFVSEISSDGSTLNYSSFLGGTNFDVGLAIAYNSGNVIVAGQTTSTNFPTTHFINQSFVQMPYIQTNKVGSSHVVTTNFYNGSFLNGATNKSPNTRNDAFVASFTTAGTSLTPRYITFLGGTNDDIAYGVAADAAGNAYVVGATTSPNFPDTTNGVNLTSFTRTNSSSSSQTNAFMTQVQWNGGNAQIGYSQIFGGANNDLARGVALDAAGNIFVVGWTTSGTNYSATVTNLIGSLTRTNSGDRDVFITAFKSDFSALLYSADFGGSKDDFGNAIAVDAVGNAYITGQTLSGTSFPIFNARQPLRDGTDSDAFLAKIWLTPPAVPELNASASGTNLLVSWPLVPLAEFTTNTLGLQTSTNLLSTKWTVVTQKPVLTNGYYIYTFRPTDRLQFFRFQNK